MTRAAAPDRGHPGTYGGITPLRPPLLWCAAAAACLDFGTIHRHHNGDSLVPVLTSLYQWTPFLWEADRIGMLVPLVAMPVRHPLVNLLLQDFLLIFGGLAAVFLLARYLLRDASYPAVAATTCSALLGLAPGLYTFEYLIDGPYGVGMALALGGLALAEPRPGGRRPSRGVLAVVLVVLGHWVNFATGLILAPLIAARWLVGRASREAEESELRPFATPGAGRDLLLIVIGSASGALLMKLSRYPQTQLGTTSPTIWVESWKQFAARTWEALAPWGLPRFAALAAVVGLGSLGVARLRSRAAPSWRAAAALAATASAVFLFLGTREWMKTNGFAFRYLIPCVLLVLTACSAVAVAPSTMALPDRLRRAAALYGPAAMLPVAAVAYGPPGPGVPRAEIDARIGSRTADVLDARCSHLTGNYWNVWPAVFHANLALHERGDPRVVWGISHRCDPSREKWMGVPLPEVRIGVPEGDPEADAWLRVFDLPPMVEVERRPTLRVLRPRSVVGTRPGDGPG